MFTKLKHAAKVIIPSDAVINKVDNFLSEVIKSTTHIPWETSNEDTLWEAGMPDFTALLQKAKFRFHQKLSSLKYSNHKSQQYYTKGNYLYDHIIPQITLAFGEISSERIQRKRHKSCSTVKPNTGCWPMMKYVTETYQQAYIQARLNTWGENRLICDCGNTVILPSVHIFFDCENEERKRFNELRYGY